MAADGLKGAGEKEIGWGWGPMRHKGEEGYLSRFVKGL